MIRHQSLRRVARGTRTAALAASLMLTGLAAFPGAAAADRDDRGRGRGHDRDDDRRGRHGRDGRDHGRHGRDGRDHGRHERDSGRRHDGDRGRHRDHDRRHWSHDRSPSYYGGHHHRAPRPVFVAPRIIHDFGVYRPYYHGRVYFPAHHHHHVVYAFPVDVGYGPVYRPYAYCDGHLFAGGHFTDYPRFSLNIRF